MVRRYNYRRVKIHRSYSVAEAAKLLDVNKLTISRWIARGLPLIERKRPYLIHGSDLRAFLLANRPARQPCGDGEIYCLRCREPRRPAADMVDYLPRTTTTGVLRGICPMCDALIHRAVSAGKVDIVARGLSIARPTAQQRIGDSADTISNVALEGKSK